MTQQTTKKAKKQVKNHQFEPNKMALAVSAAAATSLVLFAVIAMYT
jgi:hypothetical protein